jgi:hypothetical protein
MRTKILIVCLAAAFLTLGQPGRAASNRPSASPHTTSFEARQRARQTHRPATVSEQTVSGVIPRAIRGGNPLQMLNPRAPAKYGTAEDNVSLDPDVPGKGNGIKLFSISF